MANTRNDVETKLNKSDDNIQTPSISVPRKTSSVIINNSLNTVPKATGKSKQAFNFFERNNVHNVNELEESSDAWKAFLPPDLHAKPYVDDGKLIGFVSKKVPDFKKPDVEASDDNKEREEMWEVLQKLDALVAKHSNLNEDVNIQHNGKNFKFTPKDITNYLILKRQAHMLATSYFLEPRIDVTDESHSQSLYRRYR